MQLILWRHAEAEDGMADLERALTAKGRKQADKMAAFLRARLPAETRILASPARRTQQTVQALTSEYLTVPALAPSATAQELLTAVDWPQAGGCTLVVGHQPTLGEVAAQLLATSGSGFSIKKGAVWWLSGKEDEGDYLVRLKLVIGPESL